ncbi:MAG TPA: circularly permuted type 2 ATP-grasp protein, partial [Burkholderiaceae bacterium]|nr:circularly permuted type 2 ATP-grasp protein [Burkholderiaceae bacterium]
SAAGDESPLAVILTPGPYNETYFEHAYLARQLGFPLVEGSDLTVRGDTVYLKTLGGLRRVHSILRRLDDDYCDPLELRGDSALGVPGLIGALRAGRVMVSNAPGTGVLESAAWLGFLPPIAERLIGEKLTLPEVATWWLGEKPALDYVLANLDHLVIKPTYPNQRFEPMFGRDYEGAARNDLVARIRNRPYAYVAQEHVRLSQAPVWKSAASSELESRALTIRVYAVATPEGVRVMPGGLARVAGDGDARIIAMQRGGWSKDTWVLAAGDANASFSLLATTVGADDLAGASDKVSSRAAENLFWLGRYSERSEAAARLLRAALMRVPGGSLAAPDDGPQPVLALLRRQGLMGVGQGDDVAALLNAATHPDGALAAELRRLARVAFTLRDRMSGDHWRALNRLQADPVFRHRSPSTLPIALAWLDRAVTATTTLAGFVLDGMTRGTGWRFLSLGRRIERLSQLCAAIDTATHEGRVHGPGWLLDFADSTLTYRTRYPVAPEWMPVLDLLLRDDSNPRSAAFQVKGLVEFVAKLERAHGRFASDLLMPAQDALTGLPAAELVPESGALAALVTQLETAARCTSDELGVKFFMHAASRSVLARAG